MLKFLPLILRNKSPQGHTLSFCKRKQTIVKLSPQKKSLRTPLADIPLVLDNQ